MGSPAQLPGNGRIGQPAFPRRACPASLFTGQAAAAARHDSLHVSTQGLSPPSGRFAASCAEGRRPPPHPVLHFRVARGLDIARAICHQISPRTQGNAGPRKSGSGPKSDVLAATQQPGAIWTSQDLRTVAAALHGSPSGASPVLARRIGVGERRMQRWAGRVCRDRQSMKSVRREFIMQIPRTGTALAPTRDQWLPGRFMRVPTAAFSRARAGLHVLRPAFIIFNPVETAGEAGGNSRRLRRHGLPAPQ